jgi:hypothetical protein
MPIASGLSEWMRLVSGDGAQHLIWRPVIAPLQVAFFAIVLVALATFAYWRGSARNRPASLVLWLIRLIAVVVMAILLLGPSTAPPPDSGSQRVELSMVLDVSDSMRTDDCQGLTRIDAARRDWLNFSQIQRFNERCNLQFYTLGEDLASQAWEEMDNDADWLAERRATYLARNLAKAIQSQARGRDAALLVLSDGHDSEDAMPEPVADLARSRGVPVYTVTFGESAQQQDLMLVAVPLQDYLLPNEPGALLVKVYQFGLPNAQTTLHLRQGDTVQSVPIEFQGKSVVELQLEIRQSEEGQYEYELEAEPVAAEVETQNNRQRVFCQVQEKRLRVLVLEGQPFWDTKFIAQSLRKDERIELTQITQVSPENRETLVSRTGGQEAKIPSSLAEWAEYDVVIVGNQLQNMLDANLGQQLRDFVMREGGHLVFARGRCYDPEASGGAAMRNALAEVEPVNWAGTLENATQVAPEGAALAGSWFAQQKLGMDPRQVFRELPPLDRIHAVRRVKPAARTLLSAVTDRGESQPAMLTMPAGRGQVVALLGNGSWRWSLRPPTDPAQSSFYDIFWSNLVRWLVMGGDFQPGQQVTLRLSHQSLRLEEELMVEVVFKNPEAARRPWTVTWQDSEGQARDLALTQVPGQSPRFRATIRPGQVGVHAVRLRAPEIAEADQSRNFNVYEMNLERLDTSARPGFLRTLAENSGGQVLAVDQPEQLLAAIERQMVARTVPPEPEYVWDHWLFMLALLSWIGVEWILRRTAGFL